MSHDARTRKVALSRVTLRERRAGRVKVGIGCGEDVGDVGLEVAEVGQWEGRRCWGYIDWRCVEQKVSSRNSRLAAIPAARTGLMRRQNETLSSLSPSNVE
jgi:hypothetical protein